MIAISLASNLMRGGRAEGYDILLRFEANEMAIMVQERGFTDCQSVMCGIQQYPLDFLLPYPKPLWICS
jgi:hypothetical protein